MDPNPNVIIRVLNEIPYQQLDQVFQQYPQLSIYRPMYQLGIDESYYYQPNFDITERALYTEEQILNSLSSVDAYRQNHPVGFLSYKLYNTIKDLPVLDGKPLITMDILLNWWYLYILDHNLLQETTIRTDSLIKYTFDIRDDSFPIVMLQEYLAKEISLDPTINVSRDVYQQLFDISSRLRRSLNKYRSKLESIQPEVSYLQHVLSFEQSIM